MNVIVAKKKKTDAINRIMGMLSAVDYGLQILVIAFRFLNIQYKILVHLFFLPNDWKLKDRLNGKK